MANYMIGTFNVDATPPIEHALCGGLVKKSKEIRDPLSARGFVIIGSGTPIVYAIFDWCEFRNDAYYYARKAIADAIQTTPERVIISSFHPHDAPIFDLFAENLFREHGAVGLTCDIDYFEHSISEVSQAIENAIANAVPLTDIAFGKAKVDRVASNRRIPGTAIKIKAWRGSATPADSELKDEPGGLIDPYLKAIVFKSFGESVAALNNYATHPMSFYGTGRTSADFCADARSSIEMENPGTLIIYSNGCAGNIAPGKYNNGNEESRSALGFRIADAMRQAMKSSISKPIESISFNTASVDFRKHVPLGVSECRFNKTMNKLPYGIDRDYVDSMRTSRYTTFLDCWNAAAGLSWLNTLKNFVPTDISCLNINETAILSLPGEAFVEYQLAAQSFKPDGFVMTIAYGDCGMGYIPVNSSWGEGGYEETESFVACGVENDLVNGIAQALGTTEYRYIPAKPKKLPSFMKRWPYVDNSRNNKLVEHFKRKSRTA